MRTFRRSKQSFASWWDIVMVVWLLGHISKDGPYRPKRHDPLVMAAILRLTSVPDLLSWRPVFLIYHMAQVWSWCSGSKIFSYKRTVCPPRELSPPNCLAYGGCCKNRLS
ncbi:hypothetical protein AVEN_136120-1 [Araneus ventricosus]|uniref:Uncharacterized protein n=1 Tax=Araneus ventricosus TaxID=182803 RepID=A0A4Y1ZQN0_ARAVE|nr:hypothetical protein AVEN_136120-1 [Araneus ventricosus]